MAWVTLGQWKQFRMPSSIMFEKGLQNLHGNVCRHAVEGYISNAEFLMPCQMTCVHFENKCIISGVQVSFAVVDHQKWNSCLPTSPACKPHALPATMINDNSTQLQFRNNQYLNAFCTSCAFQRKDAQHTFNQSSIENIVTKLCNDFTESPPQRPNFCHLAWWKYVKQYILEGATSMNVRKFANTFTSMIFRFPRLQPRICVSLRLLGGNVTKQAIFTPCSQA